MKLWKGVATTLLLEVILCVAMPAGAADIPPANYNTTIYVVEPGQPQRDNTCSSFECISDYLFDSTEVLFNVSHVKLTIPLIIENANNIALRGNGRTTRVSCYEAGGNGNSGVQIIDATNVLIENIEFLYCESSYKYPTVKNYTLIATIHIFYSVNCTINNVVFSHANGRGLIFLQTRGMVLVTNCTFESNRFVENKYIRTIGGGVFILFNTTDDNSETTYNFNKCSFMHNNATYDVFPYGEGGGLLV